MTRIPPCLKTFLTGLTAALALTAFPAKAQLVDMDLTGGGCPSTASATFDAGVAINEDIQALTPVIGSDVFWTLATPSGDPTSCTPSDDPADTANFVCDNGITVTRPVAVSGVLGDGVTSNDPVTVVSDATVTPGEFTFSLTGLWTDGGAIFNSCTIAYTVEVLEPKDPFDLVFVLDKSGSMNTSSGGDTRWDALETGVSAFLPFIAVAAADPTPSGSRFSMILFDGGIDGNSTPIFDILDGPAAADTTDEFEAIETTLGGISPSGSTAMGAGLQEGIARSSDTSRPRVIVLFTDGEQNVDPEVTLDGCGFENPDSDINPPDCPASDGFKIITVGIGGPSGDYLTTLQALASNNRGSMILTDNGSDFTGAGTVAGDIGGTFQNIIGDALLDNSPQLVAKYAGPVQDGSNPASAGPFRVNKKAEAVMLSFAFSQRAEVPNLAQLVGSINVMRDGTNVTQEFTPVINGNFPNVVTLIAPRQSARGGMRDLSGEYTVGLGPVPDGYKPDLQYRMFAYVEERRFRANSTVDSVVHAAGDPVNVEVDLSYYGQPLDGAQVFLRVLSPDGDMGEVLSGFSTDIGAQNEDDDIGVLKFNQLASSNPEFLAALALSENAIEMTANGDGNYSASFTLSENVGAVHLVYDVIAENEDHFGTIQRHWYETIYSRFDAIDLEQSALVSTWQDNQLLLDATFRRPNSFLIGPGQARSFDFSGVDVVSRTDNLDGSYQFVLDTDDADIPIRISLAGETFYEGPAGWGEGPRGGILDMFMDLPWWKWVLLVLIVVIVLRLLRSFLRPSTP